MGTSNRIYIVVDSPPGYKVSRRYTKEVMLQYLTLDGHWTETGDTFTNVSQLQGVKVKDYNSTAVVFRALTKKLLSLRKKHDLSLRHD